MFMHVDTTCVCGMEEARRRAVRSPITGVTGNGEPTSIGFGPELESSGKAVLILNS